jgi:hypothetical protein
MTHTASIREKARQNLQVAAVNAALKLQLITLECAPVKTAKFEFALAGLPVLVCLHDAGFDEVGFYLMVAPTEAGRKLHGAGGLHWRRELCAAYAFYWLERRTGKYLQSSVNYNGTKAVTEALSDLRIVPNGFGTKPTKDGYDWFKECEHVFGKAGKRTRIHRTPGPTGISLRAEFEPMLLAPRGFCADAVACAEAWAGRSADDLQDQVDRSKEWLRLCGTTKGVSRKQTSYGLKHEAERWWKAKGAERGGYICNGALLMAALQLDMIVEHIGSTPNACLNLSRHRPCVWNTSEPCPVECQCHGHAYCARHDGKVVRVIEGEEGMRR